MLAQALRNASRSRLLKAPSTQSLAVRAAQPALIRAYAKHNKPGYSERQTTSSQQAGQGSASGQARQTSPGTSIPKDRTWTPKDSIRFGGPTASSGRSQDTPLSRSHERSAKATEEFNPGASPSKNTVPEGQPGPQPGSVNPSHPEPAARPGRSNAQETEEFNPQASPSKNTIPEGQPGPRPDVVNPSDPTPDVTENAQPKGPLPDLRQGIPSTFAKEFGLGDQAEQRGPAEGQEQFPPGEASGVDGGERPRRRAGEEEYSQSDYETSTDRARARFARYMYGFLLTFSAIGTVYFGRPYGSGEEAPAGIDLGDLSGWAPGSVWARIKSRMTGSVEYYTEPTSRKLLPELPEGQRMPYTLVLSMEDLLIHSEWSREHGWRTAKRPGVDYFLRYLNQYFELVIFTTVPYAMGEPVIRKLDPFRIVMWPLFREATKFENGKYIKDLDYLNRPLEKTLIIDTNPDHVSNQPENAIVLPKWNGDPKDPHSRDLVALIPFLEYVAAMNIPDVRKVIKSFEGKDIPLEFARREALQREEFNKRTGASGRGPKASIGGLLSSSLGIKSTPAPGSLMLGATPEDPGQTISDGLSKGKMLSDQIRERGQREYQRMEEEIRKNGEKWLKDMEEEEKKMMESSMKDMKKGWFGGFMGGGGSPAGEGRS